MPVVVKDLIDVAGAPTEAGSRQLAGNVATEDATVIGRLRAAGAIILAKANTHEFAYGALTPPTRNPWDTRRMPGGSSGGSGAAVAATEAFGALGTDSAGSVREPSALCGLAGLKPTYGNVSCRGVIPLAWSLDTVGPMTRTVDDSRALIRVMAGPDPADSATASSTVRPASGTPLRKVALLDELMTPMEPEVRGVLGSVLDCLSDAGAEIEEVEVADPDEVIATIFVILASEASAYHRRRLGEHPDRFGDDVRSYLELGMQLRAVDYVDAQRLRAVPGPPRQDPRYGRSGDRALPTRDRSLPRQGGTGVRGRRRSALPPPACSPPRAPARSSRAPAPWHREQPFDPPSSLEGARIGAHLGKHRVRPSISTQR